MSAPANIKRILLVGSGKGGVGKSHVAVNLATSLAQRGWRIGLLDADIYGPSVAHMLGCSEARIQATESGEMIPLQAHGLSFLSIANLVDDGQALVWRGPMLHSAVAQFLQGAVWGELDLLVVDLPPGTGDVQLSISQIVQADAALLVSTPQAVAQLDARRALDMFEKSQVPVIGVVENMSYFVAPDTGSEYDLFGKGGASALGLPVLAHVPIDPRLRLAADRGTPAVLAFPDAEASAQMRQVAASAERLLSADSL